MSLATLLIVDDEPHIRKFLGISLKAAGYTVLEAENAAQGLGAAAGGQPDLIILDLGLPDADGSEVLRGVREWSTIPVLVLSVRADESEKVKLLDLGANDYLTKPFGLQECLARIRNLLRASGSKPEKALHYDDGVLSLNFSSREVRLNGLEVSLTRKEFALLSLLIKHADKTLTYPQLLKEVWGPSHTEDTHYLRIAISKLRNKLGEDAHSPKYLITESGVGIRFKTCENTPPNPST